jgi:hypothetical protein
MRKGTASYSQLFRQNAVTVSHADSSTFRNLRYSIQRRLPGTGSRCSETNSKRCRRSRVASDPGLPGVSYWKESILYSYRSASIGFSREAFRAGKNPEMIPTIESMVKEMSMTLIDVWRKIAPSWSVVL